MHLILFHPPFTSQTLSIPLLTFSVQAIGLAVRELNHGIEMHTYPDTPSMEHGTPMEKPATCTIKQNSKARRCIHISHTKLSSQEDMYIKIPFNNSLPLSFCLCFSLSLSLSLCSSVSVSVCLSLPLSLFHATLPVSFEAHTARCSTNNLHVRLYAASSSHSQ